MKNNVNHVEIPVLNFKTAKAFYESIFDWKVDLDMMPDYGFVDGKPSIGFFKVDKIPESGVNVVIEVEDIDDTLKKVDKAGGKTVKEKTLIAEDIGYSAQIETNFGFQLGVFSK